MIIESEQIGTKCAFTLNGNPALRGTGIILDCMHPDVPLVGVHREVRVQLLSDVKDYRVGETIYVSEPEIEDPRWRQH